MVQCFHLGASFPKHLKENLPIHSDDPAFSQQFSGVPGDDAVPCTSKQNLPHEEEIRKQAEAAKQFFEEEQDLEVSHTIPTVKCVKFPAFPSNNNNS